jgi:transcriptional regulator with XRE-family HTH domain
MLIKPETLKTLRAGKSMKRLAQEACVDRRTIARIEKGEIAPERVRDETVIRLARALGTTPQKLSERPDHEAQREAALRRSGHRTVRTILDGRTALSFALVEKRYGIAPQRQIEMAPLFAALLAEMSLADRRRRLEAANAAFEEAMAKLPSHLGHGALAESYFNETCCDEDRSIDAKDLFGRHVLDEGSSRVVPFRWEDGNPFFNFLCEQAEALLGEEQGMGIDGDGPGHDGLPDRPMILEGYLDREICGGNEWGRRALEDGHVRVRDIPPELWKAAPAERGAWLEARYPPDLRAEKEAFFASLDIELFGVPTEERSDG